MKNFSKEIIKLNELLNTLKMKYNYDEELLKEFDKLLKKIQGYIEFQIYDQLIPICKYGKLIVHDGLWITYSSLIFGSPTKALEIKAIERIKLIREYDIRS